MVNFAKLVATLVSSKVQSTNNALYQTIFNIITAAKEADASITTADARITSEIAALNKIVFIEPDTTSAPQSVDLDDYDFAGRIFVIKDFAGNASANAITVVGTIDGVVDPTITVDYGIFRVYRSVDDGGYFTW